jgi:Cu(I)/Ag(I) efflux system periplasmic protein CusF
MKTLKHLILISCLVAVSGAARSADDTAGAAQKSESGAVPTAAPMTDGEVRKIDKDNQKITMKHGEIKNLGMPGMTMVFKVKDPAALDKLQPGDKVRFAAEKVEGSIVVTLIEAVK